MASKKLASKKKVSTKWNNITKMKPSLAKTPPRRSWRVVNQGEVAPRSSGRENQDIKELLGGVDRKIQ